jgi:hypothetical protein
MNRKEVFDFNKKNIPSYSLSECEVVINCCNELLGYLYTIDKYKGNVIADAERLKDFNIDFREPINWGSLSAHSCLELKDGGFIIELSEASPSACPTLCEYIERYMSLFGWNVIVHTEW